MQKTICLRCAKKGIPSWLPIPVNDYRNLLLASNPNSDKDEKFYTLASNVAYELQYLEFLDFLLENSKVTESIKRQTIKTFIITASNIIEGILYYELEPSFNTKEIRFSQLIKESQRLDLLETGDNFYEQIWDLKDLRNKAHIQISSNTTESDYNSFNEGALSQSKLTLTVFMKKFYKLKDDEYKKFCYYLSIKKLT